MVGANSGLLRGSRERNQSNQSISRWATAGVRFLFRSIARGRIFTASTALGGFVTISRCCRQGHTGTARGLEPNPVSFRILTLVCLEELHLLVSHRSPNALWCRCGIIQCLLPGREIPQHFRPHRSGGPLTSSSHQAGSLPCEPRLIRTPLLPRSHHPDIRLPYPAIQLRRVLCQAGRQHHSSSRLPSRTGWCSGRALVEARRD